MLNMERKVASPRHIIVLLVIGRIFHPLVLVALGILYITFLVFTVVTVKAEENSDAWKVRQLGDGRWAKEKVSYMLTDHLGSTDAVVTDDGTVFERADYLPYGEDRYRAGLTPEQLEVEEGLDRAEEVAYRFNGKERDDQTGLHYYGARYYDGGLGRFTASDPWAGNLGDPQTLNKYSYVLNNPVKYVDPTGERVELVGRAVDLPFIKRFAMHSYLLITPDRPQDFGVKQPFSFTLSGQMGSDGRLVGEINNASDLNKNLKTFASSEVKPVDGNVSDTEFINKILEIHSRNEAEEYGILSKGEEYNCNNYSTTLLEGAGAKVPMETFTIDGVRNDGLGEVIPPMVNAGGTRNNVTDFEESVLEPAKKRDFVLDLFGGNSSELNYTPNSSTKKD